MLAKVWRRWVGVTTNAPHAGRPLRSFRPRVEPLEDRFAPAAGALDPSFNLDGRLLGRTTDALVNAGIAIQADGKIIAVGSVHGVVGDPSDFAVMRFNPDGSPDGDFGIDGVVTTDFGLATEDAATCVAIQSDGSIVVAGYTRIPAFLGRSFALARYNMTDGSLDTTFGGDGLVITSFPSIGLPAPDAGTIRSITLQADGRIVVAGSVAPSGFSRMGVVRYNPDGSLDADLDADGIAILEHLGPDEVAGHVLQSDGKIVLAATNPFTDDFVLVRLNPDGSTDHTFGTNGTVTTDYDSSVDEVTCIAVQPDDKIVVAGTTTAGSVFARTNFALARYNADGSTDTSFSFDGKLATDFFGLDDEATSLAIQPNGRIVVAGFAGVVNPLGPTASDFAVARYHPDGSLDRGFGSFGKTTTSFDVAPGGSSGSGGSPGSGYGSFDRANAVAIQENGRIVVVGGTGTGIGGDRFALARYHGDEIGDIVAVGTDAGAGTFINVFDAADGTMLASISPFGARDRGGVRVAVGDIDGDGTPDIIAGRATSARIAVFRGTRDGPDRMSFAELPSADIEEWFRSARFPNGVHVAAGDINGDGMDDIIVGVGDGPRPQITVFGGGAHPSGILASFAAFTGASSSGVSVAAGDVNGDGRDDLIAGRASKGAAHVRVFDGSSWRLGKLALKPLPGRCGNLLTFDKTIRGGIFVAAGDVNGDGRADVIVSAGAGVEPRVKIYDGVAGRELANFLAYESTFRGGVRVAVGDANGDGRLDIITGQGSGGEDEVRFFEPLLGKEIDNFYGAGTRGIFVAAR